MRPIIMILAFIVLFPSLAIAQPAVSDFMVLSIKGTWQYGTLWAKGEIMNTGSLAGGPRVEVIARDSNGTLVDSAQFWPNQMLNIPPNQSRGINFPITKDKRAVTIEAKVIGVNVWRTK